MKVEPYLFFEGRAEEAMALYRSVFGADVTNAMRFREAPQGVPAGLPEGAGDKVMHANMRIGDSQIMASDGHCSGSPSFQGFGLTVTVSGAAEVDRIFNALAEDGKIAMPPQETFYSPRFGMVTDRFGVTWMILAER